MHILLPVTVLISSYNTTFATWGNSGSVPDGGTGNQLSRKHRGQPHVASQRWRAAMLHYVGLDVSLKQTSICVVNETGSVVREGARKAIEQQIDDLDRRVLKLARHDPEVRRFMTVPGIGPITALCFKATIDNPARFKRSRSVGAYVGLTARRHASGEIDWSGRISKCGDAMLRSYLFEAAGVLLTRVPK